MSVGEERSRPAIWGPVLIAAVFLAVIGGSAGWIIGQQHEREGREAAQRLDGGVPEQAPDQGGGDQGGDQGGGDQGGEAPVADERPSPTACPAHTVRLARDNGGAGPFERVLYIKTDIAEVWICRDAGGTLFYQGHRYQDGDEFVEGETSLFLTTVVAEGDEYVATNRTRKGTTVYRVSRHRLAQGDGGDDDPSYPAFVTSP